jgi:TolB-like protein
MKRALFLVINLLSLSSGFAEPLPIQTPVYLHPQTVVVWDFDNRTAPALTTLPHLDFLKRTLSETMLSALFDVPDIKVLDRTQMREILSEQKLGSGELADVDAKLRLGRMIGAQRMVFGSFMAIGDQIQVNLRAVDSATSQVIYADEYTSGFSSVLDEAQKMAGRLSNKLGGNTIKPAKEQRTALWVEYDGALALADAGRYNEAIEVLKSVLGKDANFLPAERELSVLLEKLSRQ